MFDIIKNTDGKINIIIIIVIILINFLILGGFYFFFLMEPVPEQPVFQPLESGETPPARNNARTQEARERAKEELEKAASEPDEDEPNLAAKDFIIDYATFPLGQIAVNPAGSQRFFIATITFEHRIADKNLPTELKNKLPLLNDGITSYFAKKTEEELRIFDNRDGFKTDIQKVVNDMLREGRITNVLFEQFVIQ